MAAAAVLLTTCALCFRVLGADEVTKSEVCESKPVEVLPPPEVKAETYISIKASCQAAFDAGSISDATTCVYQAVAASKAGEPQTASSSSALPGQVAALADTTDLAQAAAETRLAAVRNLASLATELTPYTDLLTMTDAGEDTESHTLLLCTCNKLHNGCIALHATCCPPPRYAVQTNLLAEAQQLSADMASSAFSVSGPGRMFQHTPVLCFGLPN